MSSISEDTTFPCKRRCGHCAQCVEYFTKIDDQYDPTFPCDQRCGRCVRCVEYFAKVDGRCINCSCCTRSCGCCSIAVSSAACHCKWFPKQKP